MNIIPVKKSKKKKEFWSLGKLTFSAVVTDNEGFGDGLADPDGSPTASWNDSNPEPELPAPNPARIVREEEIGEGGSHQLLAATIQLPEGSGQVVSCQQRPPSFSWLQDTILELLLRPDTITITAERREISLEDHNLELDRKRKGRG